MLYFGYSVKTGGDQNTQKQRFKEAIQSIKDDSQSFCLLGKGRTPSEQSVALVENGKYLGFGFFEKQEAFTSIEEVKQVITKYPDTPDIHRILNQFYTKRMAIKLESSVSVWNQGLFAS